MENIVKCYCAISFRPFILIKHIECRHGLSILLGVSDAAIIEIPHQAKSCCQILSSQPTFAQVVIDAYVWWQPKIPPLNLLTSSTTLRFVKSRLLPASVFLSSALLKLYILSYHPVFQCYDGLFSWESTCVCHCEKGYRCFITFFQSRNVFSEIPAEKTRFQTQDMHLSPLVCLFC